MYKQPSETNNFFSLRCLFRRVFRIKNSLLRHLNEISAYFCFFCFALLTQLSVMMTADNRNLIIPRGVRPDYLFLIVSLKKKSYTHELMRSWACFFQIHSQKKFSLFYILRMINLGISITLEKTWMPEVFKLQVSFFCILTMKFKKEIRSFFQCR